MKQTTPEAKIQSEIVRWFHNTYCLRHHSPRCAIFSVANELAGTNKIAMMQAKATGLMPGVSDLIVVMPGEILFCEVKNEIGRQGEKQKEFEEIVSGMGYRYILVRSLNEFKTALSQ